MKYWGPLMQLIMIVLSSTSLMGQDENNQVPLEDLLLQFEKQHGYHFNYDKDLIGKEIIIPPDSNLSFNQAIAYLEKNTAFQFTVTEDNFVLISEPTKEFRVCGYIQSNVSGEPLAFANVMFGKKGTTTDKKGYFELKTNTNSGILSVTYVGFQTNEFFFDILSSTACLDIKLLPKEETLSEIIISGFIVQGIDKMKDGGLRIDFSKFSMLPGLIESDVLQSVQAFPGIQSINETVSNINVRGGTHDQNLILWDDIKMYQSGHFFGLISIFNPNITEKVTLLKNGTSAAYTEGVSSTIAMRTDTELTDHFTGKISASFIDTNGFIDTPIGKKSSVQVAVRKALSNFAETPTYDAYFDRIAQNTEVESNEVNITNSDKMFDFYDASLRWLYKINDKSELRLNFIGAANELVYTESSIINTIERSRESSLSQNSIAGGLQYKRTWNDRFSTVLQAYNTDYKLQAFNVNLARSQRFLQENIVSETGIRAHAFYNISDRLEWQNGYHFTETAVTNLDDVDDPVFRDFFVEVLRTHSVFTQLHFGSHNRKTYLDLGVRYNYLDKFSKSIVEPRINFNQKIARDLTFEIQGELKHQSTSKIINFQNDFLGIENRRWQLTDNDSIPIIRSKQISSGLQFEKKGWLLNVEGYYKYVDGITTRSQGFTNAYEFVREKGSYDAYGIDFLLRKRWGGFNFWSSYSYLKSEYTFDALPEETFPSNFDTTHSISSGISFKSRDLQLAAGFNWRTGRPTTSLVFGNEVDNQGDLNYNTANAERLDDYFRFDVSAMYQIRFATPYTLNLGASVWNVFDQENTINNYYRLNTNRTPQEFVQRSLGIVPNVSIKMNF
ncbi:TonB-dependent receptor [Aquimarina celericrescens]|nr:TonB-dependent receptor [Aquimarina celericrescens]